jgi:hypothetical protein
VKIARTLKTSLLILLATITYNASAEVFILENVKKAQADPYFPPALIKTYKANRPIDVKYNYSYDSINDQKQLLLKFSTEDTAIQDLLDFGVIVDNVDSPIIKNSQIVSRGLPTSESCAYIGSAKVTLTDIWLLIPEVASEVETGAEISKVLVASRPQLECY